MNYRLHTQLTDVLFLLYNPGQCSDADTWRMKSRKHVNRIIVLLIDGGKRDWGQNDSDTDWHFFFFNTVSYFLCICPGWVPPCRHLIDSYITWPQICAGLALCLCASLWTHPSQCNHLISINVSLSDGSRTVCLWVTPLCISLMTYQVGMIDLNRHASLQLSIQRMKI